MVSGCNAGMGQPRGIQSADPRSQGVNVRQGTHTLGGCTGGKVIVREEMAKDVGMYGDVAERIPAGAPFRALPGHVDSKSVTSKRPSEKINCHLNKAGSP